MAYIKRYINYFLGIVTYGINSTQIKPSYVITGTNDALEVSPANTRKNKFLVGDIVNNKKMTDMAYKFMKEKNIFGYLVWFNCKENGEASYYKIIESPENNIHENKKSNVLSCCEKGMYNFRENLYNDLLIERTFGE